MRDKKNIDKEPEDVLVIEHNTIYEIDMHCIRCKSLHSERYNEKKQDCEDGYNREN